MTDTRENQKECYLLLDVGGTQIKCALAEQNGNILTKLHYYPSYAKEKKDVLFQHFAFIIQEILSERKEVELKGIGMAFPGPFDYENGISLMSGLNKYDSIYGIPIESEIKKLVPLLNYIPFCFLHDVEAFAIGESWFGTAKNSKKLLCLCIGTGIGSAFLNDHTPLKNKEKGVPSMGWLYNSSFKKSILDDYISVRGLTKLSKRIYGKEITGKELYTLCKEEDPKALNTFAEFGEDLFKGISPFIQEFMPDAVVFGGQISKSFSYFGQSLTQFCQKEKIEIYLEEETSILAIQGLIMEMERRETLAKL